MKDKVDGFVWEGRQSEAGSRVKKKHNHDILCKKIFQ